jgi:hypothetical protein
LAAAGSDFTSSATTALAATGVLATGSLVTAGAGGFDTRPNSKVSAERRITPNPKIKTQVSAVYFRMKRIGQSNIKKSAEGLAC